MLAATVYCFLAVTSCSDIIVKDILENENTSQAGTRSVGTTDYYYWYNGEKIGIPSLDDLYYVSSSDSLELEAIDLSSNNLITRRRGLSIENHKKAYWKIVEVKIDATSKSSITNTKTLSSFINNKNIHVAPVFGASAENYVSTSEYFYVKLKSSEDYQILVDVASEFAAEIVKEVPYMPNWYLLKSSASSNGLNMSNQFYESGKFDNVDAGFMFNFKTSDCPAEPDFGKQWGLNKINACTAWDITKGNSNVLVAVLDQGVDKSHKEFANNYSSLSYDIHNGSSPSVLRGDHGTHVGGIIGANHNGVQIAGVAPQATILSVSHSLSVTTTTSGELASGIGYATAKGAAVINNSWGDQGGRLYDYLHSTILEDAIKTAMSSGRNGKGMVVVFASGNANSTKADYPANFDPDILVIGSTNSSDSRSSYSSYGSCLDVVAPGESILSTLPNNSTGYMSGTSMAAPHVAGLAALILSVNPELSRAEVVNIIEKTAQKIGSYSYSTVSGRSNGTWNNEMGYGQINTFAAVSSASGDIVIFNDKTVSTNQTVAGWMIQSQNVTVTNGAKLTFSAGKSTTISAPFIINSGSQLEITAN
jgi:subtilisin family serine protease